MSKSHVTDIRSRTYSGEALGKILVRALRGELFRDRAHTTERITRLIEANLLELDQILSSRTEPIFFRDAGTGFMRPDPTIWSKVETINVQLSRYRVTSGIELENKSWILLQWAEDDPDEWGVIETALDLGRTGQLSRVRRCSDCGNWYFARFAHQRFCTARCRERAFRSSDEWKKHRREKAQEYYWLHKNKNIK